MTRTDAEVLSTSMTCVGLSSAQVH